eukprot:7805507-Pyramimonas_sp.AAC.1
MLLLPRSCEEYVSFIVCPPVLCARWHNMCVLFAVLFLRLCFVCFVSVMFLEFSFALVVVIWLVPVALASVAPPMPAMVVIAACRCEWFRVFVL